VQVAVRPGSEPPWKSGCGLAYEEGGPLLERASRWVRDIIGR
jgi:hypothetical protein